MSLFVFTLFTSYHYQSLPTFPEVLVPNSDQHIERHLIQFHPMEDKTPLGVKAEAFWFWSSQGLACLRKFCSSLTSNSLLLMTKLSEGHFWEHHISSSSKFSLF